MRLLPKTHRIESDAGELERYWIYQNCVNAVDKADECDRRGDLKTRDLYRLVESLCVKALDRFGGGTGAGATVETAVAAKKELPAVAESLSTVLLRMLKDGKAREINGLVFASGKPASEVLSELLKLELSGKVKKLPVGRYQRR